MDVTKKELHILRHSLGLTRGNKSYRNRFCTDENSDDYLHCEALVSKGLMVRRKNSLDEMSVSYVYYATGDGQRKAEENSASSA